MKKIKLLFFAAVMGCLTLTTACKKDKGEATATTEVHDHDGETLPIDKAQFDAFFC